MIEIPFLLEQTLLVLGFTVALVSLFILTPVKEYIYGGKLERVVGFTAAGYIELTGVILVSLLYLGVLSLVIS